MQSVLKGKAGYSPVFWLRRSHLCCERFSPLAQIDHRQHRESTVGIFGKPAIANLGEAPDALECQKRMFDLGTHAGLAPVGLPVRIAQGPAPVCPLVGEIFRPGRNLLEPLALFLAPVGTVAVEPSLTTVQQVGQFLTVVHIAGGGPGCMHTTTPCVRPDMP